MDFTLFTFLLFVHIVAAMVWIGGALTGTLIGTRINRSGDGVAMAAFCKAFATIAGPLFGGSGMLVLASGLWMVADSASIEFSEAWVGIGILGWLISLILGAGPVGMSWTRIGVTLDTDPGQLPAVQDKVKRAVMLTHADLLLRIAIVLLMVWRPA